MMLNILFYGYILPLALAQILLECLDQSDEKDKRVGRRAMFVPILNVLYVLLVAFVFTARWIVGKKD